MRSHLRRAAALAAAMALAPVATAHGSPVQAYRVHAVRAGDTLSEIAARYGVSVKALAAANHLANVNLLRVGQELLVPLEAGGATRETARLAAGTARAASSIQRAMAASYTVRPGDTLAAIAARFHTSVRELARLNGIADPDRLSAGQQLTVLTSGGDLRAASLTRILSPVFQWPLRGVISSAFGPRWGRMHEGIDIAAPYGVPIRAAAPGVVVRAGWESGYGRVVVLRHSFGLVTVYGHASRLLVKEGEAVAMGQPLALVGQSGDATGPHLHFEIRIAGTAENPLPFLRSSADGAPSEADQPVAFTVGR
ncbi:MAG: M23 family metallopeptidase [Clostridia bacterium]|nr:M23 family metallopeptidase [Clostridia bacterium]